MGILKHQRDCYPPGIMERTEGMGWDWPWSGMKVSNFISFLLWHIDVSWTVRYRKAPSKGNIMQVTNMSHGF